MTCDGNHAAPPCEHTDCWHKPGAPHSLAELLALPEIRPFYYTTRMMEGGRSMLIPHAEEMLAYYDDGKVVSMGRDAQGVWWRLTRTKRGFFRRKDS